MIMLLVFSLLVAAQDAPVAKPTTSNVSEEKTVCRLEIVSGSNFRRKVCGTRKEWSQLAQARDDANERSRAARNRAGTRLLQNDN
jgi:hypothetical protein